MRRAGPKNWVSEIESLQDFFVINGQDWREEVYRNTRVVIGNPIQGDIGHQIVVIEEDDPGMEKSLRRLCRQKFAELVDIKESLETMEVILKVGGRTRRRVIYRAKMEAGQARQGCGTCWGDVGNY